MKQFTIKIQCYFFNKINCEKCNCKYAYWNTNESYHFDKKVVNIPTYSKERFFMYTITENNKQKKYKNEEVENIEKYSFYQYRSYRKRTRIYSNKFPVGYVFKENNRKEKGDRSF